jgi:hypothetical protein
MGCNENIFSYINHADSMFSGKAEQAYTPKSTVYCPPFPLHIPVDIQEQKGVEVLLIEHVLSPAQWSCQRSQVVTYSGPEFEAVGHPSQYSGQVAIPYPADPRAGSTSDVLFEVFIITAADRQPDP